MFKIENKSEKTYINLKEIDIYTLMTFEDLQNQRFINKLDYYICVVKQSNKTYLFDAVSFIENCLHEEKLIVNPLTKDPIKNFDILVSSKENPNFKLYMKKDELLKFPNHYPVVWNDPSISKANRIYFKFHYAKHLESTNLKASILLYQKFIEEGDLFSRMRLAEICTEKGKKTQAISLIHGALERADIGTQNLIFCAENLKKNNDFPGSFKACQLAAKRNSPYGIGGVICSLEDGVGVEKNSLLAKEWRQKLPDGWKEATIVDFFKHLQEIKYDPNRTEYP
ncbi:MAG: hypothetical protein P0S93_01855 [Candidatus Neptunochlamydia sp.]|nr:hypothetical protein [Candidatus Neptunochlamydia sp.]